MKNRPLFIVMAFLGALIVFANTVIADETVERSENPPATERVREGAHELASGTKSVAREIKEGVKEGAHVIGKEVVETAGEAKEVAKDAVKSGKKVVKEVVHTVVETTGDALHGTGRALKAAGEEIREAREGEPASAEPVEVPVK